MGEDRPKQFRVVEGGRGTDPNEGRNDPMVAEHWQLGEAIQEIVAATGYQTGEVEGIAVDIHDLLQAADRIRTDLGPKLCNFSREQREELRKHLRELAFELDHIRWHSEAAVDYLDGAVRELGECDDES
jgi:hypothetical protein